MPGAYDGGGDMKAGGFFVHLRDGFGRCQWAFVTARISGQDLNLKVIPNDPDHTLWRPCCKHGADKHQWHHPDQCQMTSAEIREDEEKALAGVRGK